MGEKRTYNTRQRDQIMKCISAFGTSHFTAADVVAKLLSEGNAIGQATVYRMIDRLAETGELRKYIIDGTTAACYQLAHDVREKECHEHFHLKCEKCGRLIHVECEELSKISSHMKEDHGFQIDSSKTVFYGLCEDCAAFSPEKS